MQFRMCYWPNLKVTSTWLTQSEGDVTLVDQIWRWAWQEGRSSREAALSLILKIGIGLVNFSVKRRHFQYQTNLYLWGSEQTGLHRSHRRRGGSHRAGCRISPQCSTRPRPCHKASAQGPQGPRSQASRRRWPSLRSPPSWRGQSHWSWSCYQGQGCNTIDYIREIVAGGCQGSRISTFFKQSYCTEKFL